MLKIILPKLFDFFHQKMESVEHKNIIAVTGINYNIHHFITKLIFLKNLFITVIEGNDLDLSVKKF